MFLRMSMCVGLAALPALTWGSVSPAATPIPESPAVVAEPTVFASAVACENCATLAKQLGQAEAELQGFRASTKELADSTRELVRDYDAIALERDGLREKVANLQAQQTRLTNTNNTLSTEKTRLRGRVNGLCEERTMLQNNYERSIALERCGWQKRVTDLQAQRARLANETNTLSTKNASLEGEVRDEKALHQATQKSLASTQQALDDIRRLRAKDHRLLVWGAGVVGAAGVVMGAIKLLKPQKQQPAAGR